MPDEMIFMLTWSFFQISPFIINFGEDILVRVYSSGTTYLPYCHASGIQTEDKPARKTIKSTSRMSSLNSVNFVLNTADYALWK